MKISYLVVAVLAAVMAVAMAGNDVEWCQSKDTCGDCVKGLSCIWCPEEGVNKQGACFHGKPWGAIDGASITKCSGYRYLQCKIPGLALVIIICVGAGLVLLALLLCICCCCCCRKKRQSTTSYAMLPSSDVTTQETFTSSSINNTNGGSAYSAHPVTDARRRDLNEKYNKYRSPAESYY